MRASHVATALAAFLAGLTTAAAVRRQVDRRSSAPVPAAPVPADVATSAAADVPADVTTPASVDPAAGDDAVVLPFLRPTAPAPAEPAAPTRCGDSGGRTKAGAPCAARATGDGRCHHHRVAA